MNKFGVSIGVDVLRGANVNTSLIGLNSILLVRHVADYAKSTADAVMLFSRAKRGVTWLYPICDISDCVVIESGKYEQECGNPLDYVAKELKKILPTKEFLDKYGNTDCIKGMYIRKMNWKYPKEFLRFNEDLIKYSGEKYEFKPEMWEEKGMLFGMNFTLESEVSKKLMNYYFPPQRENSDDLILGIHLF